MYYLAHSSGSYICINSDKSFGLSASKEKRLEVASLNQIMYYKNILSTMYDCLVLTIRKD